MSPNTFDQIVKGDQLEREIERLKDAIRKHRDAKGNDRCWLNDHELYAVLGEPLPDLELPSEVEFIKGCIKYYIEQKKLQTKKPHSEPEGTKQVAGGE